MRLILLGAVAQAHGLRGELTIVPFHPESPLWRAGVEAHLVSRERIPAGTSRTADVIEVDSPDLVTIETVRPAPKGRLVVRLSGVVGRNAADALKGAVLGLPADAMGELDADEFFYHEVPGWRVVTTGGEPVGKIVRALPGATELFEVRPDTGGETFYIPIIQDVVTRIDRAAGVVEIELIEGLLP